MAAHVFSSRRAPAAAADIAFAPSDNGVAPESDTLDAALTKVRAYLARGEQLVVVSGPPGTGKTLLLQRIETSLRRTGAPVRALVSAAHLAHSAEAPGLLIVDEAEHLGAPLMAMLARRLKQPKRQTVIAATDSTLPGLPSAAKDAPQVTLRALDGAEARALVKAFAAKAGAGERFDADAVDTIVVLSRGIPRLIKTMVNNALFEASLAGSATISRAHAVEGARLYQATDADIAASAAEAERVDVPAPAVQPPAAAPVPEAAMAARAPPPPPQGISRGTLKVAAFTGAMIALAILIMEMVGTDARERLPRSARAASVESEDFVTGSLPTISEDALLRVGEAAPMEAPATEDPAEPDPVIEQAPPPAPASRPAPTSGYPAWNMQGSWTDEDGDIRNDELPTD